MKQLLIIGNGFDLACGLKSSYGDFFDSEIKGKKHDGFWEKLLIEENKNNIVNVNYNWCDIEKIIFKTLWKINFGDSELNSPNCDKGLYNRGCNGFEGQNSVELFLLDYCVAFYNNLSRKNTVPFDIKMTLEEQLLFLNKQLLIELRNLEKKFCKYLRGMFTFEYVINAVNLFAKLTGFSEIVFTSMETIYKPQSEVLLDVFKNLNNTHILNFNYTVPLESITKLNIFSHRNVHGKMCHRKCDENCSFSTAIFGIDDKVIQSNKVNSELRLFSKTYRTLFINDKEIKILPKKEDLCSIKFFGHSLNEADYSYFQSIFDYYSIYDSNVVLEFYYSPFRKNNKNKFERMNYVKGKETDAVYKLINTYGATRSNQDQGKNLLHKLVLENRIKIQEPEKLEEIYAVSADI